MADQDRQGNGSIQQQQEWTKHPHLYYKDGIIVLLADSRILFKVYSGILCEESEVFLNMMAGTGQLPKNGETYDECPLVRLADDPKILGYFLESLMGKINLLGPASSVDSESFVIALGILHLSHKYMASRHMTPAVRWFARIIPEDFDNAKQMDAQFSFSPWYAFIWNCLVMSTAPKGSVVKMDVAAIFLKCGLYRFLPWTLYMISSYGSSLCLPERLLNIEETPLPLPKWVMERLIPGRQRLENLYFKNIWKVVKATHPNCTGKYSCNETLRLDLLERLTQTPTLMWLRPSGIPLKASLNSKDSSTSFVLPDGGKMIECRLPCMVCRKLWLEKSEVLVEKAWLELPKIFGLPG
ncbi:hypothetical protein M422DRAFT_265288 [Sphaerobolus stellatus SS14]|uniref:BTB domain-containing protein n=1 Tax=Sphaerobolus stellatus (strain SS14) TaxID=990650 RepID=A0A0C9V5Y7_SPHS4|nr:hypothetical protein M422DRAFT_265288 [Sphaerobolus stellatus SS14]